MANWVSISINTLYGAKVAALIDAADARALKAGQPNRSAGIISDVVNEIRRKIASHQRNQLDVDVTKIPQGLNALATDMIIARLKTAIEQELSEDERRNLTRHTVNLDRIAEGKDVVDAPDNPIVAPMEPLVPPPSFGPKPHRRVNELNG